MPGPHPAPSDPQSQAAPLLPKSNRPVFEDLVDMTAMVDIVFFLLIFFMVTSMQGIYASIGMPSPDQQKGAAQGRRTIMDFEKDTDFVIVRIQDDGSIWVDGAEVPSEQDLRIKLRGTRRGAGSPNKMLVLGSSEARHGTVVMVLDAGNDAGMDEVQLAVDDET
jgi:biopolymer transport protein ExbD